MIKFNLIAFLLILIVVSPIVLAEDDNIGFNIIQKYNVIYENGPPESYQLIEFDNLNKPLHPITIFISYPENAQFKSILQTPGKNTSKTHINEVPLSDDAFEQLIFKISDEDIRPLRSYNKKVFKIHLPENDTLLVKIVITHKNIDEKLWYVNALGSSGGSSLLYESGDFSLYDIQTNLWWRRIEIKNPISQGTVLRFPHKIDYNLPDIRPVRVQYGNDYKVRVKPNDGVFGVGNESGEFSISL